MSRWITIYYRDENKIMRKVKGVKLAKRTGEIWYLKSVYTNASDEVSDWNQLVKKND